MQIDRGTRSGMRHRKTTLRIAPLARAPVYRSVGLGKGFGVYRIRLLSRRGTLACSLLAAMGAAFASYCWSAALEDGLPQFERRDAAQAACDAAAAAIFRERPQSGITFRDDCRRPNVTPLFGRPGLLVVNRAIDVRLGDTTARRSYSVLMDGRRPDAWQAVRIEPAPNSLSIVFAPVAPDVAAAPAERSDGTAATDRSARKP
jgi:hypothetical protein